LPDQAWLSRNWLRGWVDVCAQFVESIRDDNRWHDPRLASLEPLRQRVSDLWDHREELFAVAEEPPLTISHWDFWPMNLYAGDDIVAIDWSQIGLSGVAHDLDQLTLDTVWMHIRPDESLTALEDLVLPAYVEGLHESGYEIELEQLRRWYGAAAALRYAWLGGGQVDLVADPKRVQSQETRFGRDIATITATKARAMEHALVLGERVLAG
jgi:thiamine kinase-like enzyme